MMILALTHSASLSPEKGFRRRRITVSVQCSVVFISVNLMPK
jgi:hypothetical protein